MVSKMNQPTVRIKHTRTNCFVSPCPINKGKKVKMTRQGVILSCFAHQLKKTPHIKKNIFIKRRCVTCEIKEALRDGDVSTLPDGITLFAPEEFASIVKRIEIDGI